MTKKIVPFEISLKSTKRAGFTFQPRPQILTNDANSAELNFIITDTSTEELAGSTATVLLFMKDGSFFQNTDVTRANNTFIYTIKPNQAKHKGVAQVQLVVKIGSVENASPLMEVDIVGGLESKPIVEREIQDWTSLTAEAKAFVEQIKDFTLEGFVENKMGEELANLETNYATRLTGLERKDTELTAQLAQTATLALKNETSTDDTTQIQNAINTASAGSGVVKLSKNKVYTVGSIVPKENVIIDLNGSKLKLKANANLPLIYDYLHSTVRSNFGIINGTLDCNMANNSDAINQSAGGVWLTNWDNLYFRNIKLINAFRNAFNFFGVKNVVAENIIVKDCGRTNANGFYSYGFSLESSPQRRNKNIVLKNFICENMYGFGIHIRQTDGFDFSNIELIDLVRLNDSIGITLTDATSGNVNNVDIKKGVKTYSVDSHAIEINASKKIVMENISVDSVRTSDILFGDNGSGLSSELVKLTNVKTTNTPSFSMSVNFIDGLVVENGNFDKGFTNTYILPTKNVLFSRCKFSVVCNALMTFRHFGYRDTMFSDLFILEKINETVKLGYAFSLADTATKTISLAVASIEQMFVGDVDIVTKWSGNFGQGSYAKYHLYAYANTVQNSVLASKIAGRFERFPTIAFSGKNLSITNSTGGSLTVNVLFQNKSITGMGLS